MISKLLFSFISVHLILRIFTSSKFLKKFFFTFPNKRSSHQKPTLTGGGIAFIIPTVIISIISICENQSNIYDFVVLISLPLSIVGLLDDIKGAPALTRFISQSLTVLILIIFFQIQELSFIKHDYVLIMFLIFTIKIIFGSAIINFINFMDGLDGFVTSNIIVALIPLAIKLDNHIWILIFALLAFLFWNWSPAKVFMGDVGSTYLGAIFVGTLFLSNSIYEFISSLIVISPFLADALVCILRRLINGQNIFSAHKLHLYQRLNQAGWSHSKVTLIYMMATLTLALVSFYKSSLLYIFCGLIFLIGYILDKYVAYEFSASLRNQ